MMSLWCAHISIVRTFEMRAQHGDFVSQKKGGKRRKRVSFFSNELFWGTVKSFVLMEMLLRPGNLAWSFVP